MGMRKAWAVDVTITEQDDQRRTLAEARLHTEQGSELRGTGIAWRHPQDRDIPEVGDELATARAMDDLSHKLRRAVASEITESTGAEPTLTPPAERSEPTGAAAGPAGSPESPVTAPTSEQSRLFR